MFINNIQKNYSVPNFKGKIIDSHVHCGQWNFDKFPCNEVLKIFNKKFNGGRDYVDRIIISNLDCIKNGRNNKPLKDEINGNLSLIKSAIKNKKIVPFLVCQPGFGAAENIELLLIKYLDVIGGLKFHPACLNLAANDIRYLPYMTLAAKYNKPCLFHCEVLTDKNGKLLRNGVSDPEFIYETARRFPNVPVILGHMGAGGGKAHEAAIKTLIKSIDNADAKLYADISWVDCDTSVKPHIVDVIKRLQYSSKGDMTERLLFGTDAPLGVFGEKAMKQDGAYNRNIINIKKAIKENFGDDANKLISRIFYRNSKKLLTNTEFNKIG